MNSECHKYERSQGVISSARRSAKAEVRGASPRESANIQGRDVTVSISACDADCAGANPVALTNLLYCAACLACRCCLLASCFAARNMNSWIVASRFNSTTLH
jgi:hypothetical protein